jgi:hypothetical protein
VGTVVRPAFDITAEFAESIGARLDATRRNHLVARSRRDEYRFSLDSFGLAIRV